MSAAGASTPAPTPPAAPVSKSVSKSKKRRNRKRNKKKKKAAAAPSAGGSAAAPPVPPAAEAGEATQVAVVSHPAVASADGTAVAEVTKGADALTLKELGAGTDLKKLKKEQLYELYGYNNGKKKEKKGTAHKFWDTQPVPKINEQDKSQPTGPVDREKTTAEVRQEPYGLPKGFMWSSIDVNDIKQIKEVYQLLHDNYVEDDDNMFRFDYSVPFLQWALQPPGFKTSWHVGVRQISNKKLRGFITGVPATVRVCGKSIDMAEINFLCVHKRLRSKRLAPVLIKEVTRRINCKNVWQAVYTAGVVLPKPISRSRYWHRSLNPKKLIDVGFSRIGPRMNMARTIRLYRLKDSPMRDLRHMTKADVPSACKLLNGYLSQFDLAVHFSEADFAHWMLPRDGVIDTYVLTNSSSGDVTDLVSFYHLPSSIIGHAKYNKLYAVYSYYNVATTVPLRLLMEDCLILARSQKADVFNALDVMDNSEFLEELKFGIGDGHLQYYLYNYRTPLLDSKSIGLVLL